MIIGKISAGLLPSGTGGEILYIQKIAFLMGAALCVQVLAGHRLPLVLGPSTVLLIGMIAGRESGAAAVYSSIFYGGVLLSILSVTGLFAHLKRLFTTRIVSVVLLLIAFTLAPTILNLIASPIRGRGTAADFTYAAVLILAMFLAYRHLPGIWKSLLIVITMAAGSLLYDILFADRSGPESFLPGTNPPLLAGFFQGTTSLSPAGIDAGVLISFLFCFMALMVNDLGSIQSVNEILKAEGQPRRITRGILVTGLANAGAGFLGVIGPVNFSLSPGVIASSRCASRFTLLPAGALLLVLSFSPAVLSILARVPSVLVGCVLLFILSSQVSAGLAMLFEPGKTFQFESGLVVGLPILLGTVIAFMPPQALAGFPAFVRPIAGNGFIVGMAASLVLEHLVFRNRL